MTDLRCVVCGAETDAYLDVICTNRLERHLAELPSLFAELVVTETRQGRTYRAGGRSEREPEPAYDPEADVEPRLRSKGGRIALRGFALPYDEAASVLREEAESTLAAWIRHLCERSGIDVPDFRIGAT